MAELPGVERETLDVDVVIVGAGPAGLAAAYQLARLIKANNESPAAAKKLENISIAVLEKGKEIGSHAISGAVMDPRGIADLLPDWLARGCPIESPVTDDGFWLMSEKWKFSAPILPPPLQNEGNYVLSLGEMVRWLAPIVSGMGVDLFPEFAASRVLTEDGRVVGVRIGDKGIDKNGQAKANFEPGVDIRAKVTILAEGPRGTLTKQLAGMFDLYAGKNPQVYSVGVKELWQVPDDRFAAGTVIHTVGWPLDADTFGGGFIYGMKDRIVDIGLVVGLDYRDPTLDPHHEFQRYKLHPSIRALLEGGKMIRYGAKSLPYAGWYSMPPLGGNGWMMVGDSAGFLNSQRLKGIHLAIKSGMLAAETAFEALRENNFTEAKLKEFKHKVDASWIRDELYEVRNFHQGFEKGLVHGLLHSALQQFTGGRGLHEVYTAHAGHRRLQHLEALPEDGGKRAHMLGQARGDSKLTFDKLTDLYHSGTKHEEDQPSHLIIHDTNICNTR